LRAGACGVWGEWLELGGLGGKGGGGGGSVAIQIGVSLCWRWIHS